MNLPQTDAERERSPLAYLNSEFLNSADGRIFRIISEYSEPLARFRRQGIQDTVVFFGSARFHSRQESERALSSLVVSTEAEKAELRRQAQVAVEMAGYYEDARRLAYMLTEWTQTLKSRRHRFVVTSGGGPGIMEAANRGAIEAGGKSIGLTIRLPLAEEPNSYVTPGLDFDFHYFFMRKFWFAYLAKALVVFPGGFGTLDEFFEILTLAQTQKLAKRIAIVVYGSSYWNSILDMDALVAKGTIFPRDRELFHLADTPEQAFRILKDALVLELEQGSKGRPAADGGEEQAPEIARTR